MTSLSEQLANNPQAKANARSWDAMLDQVKASDLHPQCLDCGRTLSPDETADVKTDGCPKCGGTVVIPKEAK